MGTGYTRQSGAEIVDGQVADASDFNNEFDAIEAFADGTTGHAHDGSSGEGPVLDINTATSGTLSAAQGGVHTASADPTATDDTPDFVVGSVWVNTTTKDAFVCIDNTSTSAKWRRLHGNTSAGAPAVTNDIDEGYNLGDVWIDTSVTPNTFYICLDNTDGAAVWVPVQRGRNHYTTSSPGVTNDVDEGFEIGSVWVNTSSDAIFICADATDGAAVWAQVNNSPTWEVKTGADTFGNGDKWMLNASGTFTVTGSATPSEDDAVEFKDFNSTLSGNNVTIDFNGASTESRLGSTLVLDTDGCHVLLTYKSSAWRLTIIEEGI